MKQNAVNKDVFAVLRDRTEKVYLPSANVELAIRRMSWICVIELISELVEEAQNSMLQRGSSFIEAMQGALKNTEDLPDDDPNRYVKLFEKLIPVIVSMVQKTPRYVNRILEDVVIIDDGLDSDTYDETTETLRQLPVEDCLAIVTHAIDLIDKGALARQVNDLFFGIAEGVRAVSTLMEKKDEEKKTASS